MSDEQSVRHSRNHGKDKFTQPCGFSMDEKTEPGAAVADRLPEGYTVRLRESETALSTVFDNEDDAVDFFYGLPVEAQRKAGIYRSGICVMQ